LSVNVPFDTRSLCSD